MRVTVSDVVSPSYIVLTAAVELGFFKAEGLDAEFVFPPVDPGHILTEGNIDFYGASPYIAFERFPNWQGGKILCALSQYTYWFLAMRADVNAARGDLDALRGRRVSASGQPGVLLRHLLNEAGFGPDQVQVVPAPTPPEGMENLSRVGIQALREGTADGFWGNAMRAELAIRHGMATMLLDIRRGAGPAVARDYTFAALCATDQFVAQQPAAAAAAVRAVVKTQRALQANPSLVTQVADRIFPPEEASLIATLVERDTPFYDATVSRAAFDGAVRFAQAIGQVTGPLSYDAIVATQFQPLWIQ